MARFRRGDEHAELVLDGLAIVEGSAFGEARRVLHDARAARIAYYQRITELLDDRWTRNSAFVDDLVPDAEPPFVLDDADALSVYRDWLIERGDPRGELAALRAADSPDTREISSLEKTRGVELFGPFALLPRTWREHVAFGWRHGWIDELVMRHVDGGRVQPGEIMHAALHVPMARFARWLTVDRYYIRTLHECIAPCTCTDRIIGLRVTDGSLTPQGLAALPALEELELLDDDWLATGHPNVNRLRISTVRDVPPLGAFPKLRRLELVVDALPYSIETLRARYDVDVTIRSQD